MIKEIRRNYPSGYLALIVLPELFIANGWMFFSAVRGLNMSLIVVGALLAIILFICFLGFFMVHRLGRVRWGVCVAGATRARPRRG